ncbi:HD domain-containing protein [Dyadobacter sp. CY323]|uniref:HD domain-containing protein n=1 Tax=Dyadobacter sp. CY323 TaxID=2907302 RepID=UPI001F1A4D05|nr:HD domain-containing protein [Dyadobacter sp. CY323]MCE6989939.1 HD domain-containing protein [Dyadobacter sp. CY323]
MRVEEVEKFMIEKMRSSLDPNLHYHGLHHTLDVIRATAEIAELEGIADEESLNLLKTAALFHDSGFMNTYQGHEEESCRIAREVLIDFDYSPEQIDQICGMIMATKIPQNPKTHLERIISDADLDYLGRNDFWPIAMKLFVELNARGTVHDLPTWNKIQEKFIESHSYWTESERNRRDEMKRMHLAGLR